MNRIFLGVEQYVSGRAWRDRLDERAAQSSLAIVQQHGLPELLARIIAGRGVAVDEVPLFLDPTVRDLMPDPDVLTAMPAAVYAASDSCSCTSCRRKYGHHLVDR